MARWFEFQDHWAEVLPAIPLYSNTYYDAFTSDLVGYHPERYFSWAETILHASLKN